MSGKQKQKVKPSSFFSSKSPAHELYSPRRPASALSGIRSWTVQGGYLQSIKANASSKEGVKPQAQTVNPTPIIRPKSSTHLKTTPDDSHEEVRHGKLKEAMQQHRMKKLSSGYKETATLIDITNTQQAIQAGLTKTLSMLATEKVKQPHVQHDTAYKDESKSPVNERLIATSTASVIMEAKTTLMDSQKSIEKYHEYRIKRKAMKEANLLRLQKLKSKLTDASQSQEEALRTMPLEAIQTQGTEVSLLRTQILQMQEQYKLALASITAEHQAYQRFYSYHFNREEAKNRYKRIQAILTKIEELNITNPREKQVFKQLLQGELLYLERVIYAARCSFTQFTLQQQKAPHLLRIAAIQREQQQKRKTQSLKL